MLFLALLLGAAQRLLCLPGTKAAPLGEAPVGVQRLPGALAGVLHSSPLTRVMQEDLHSWKAASRAVFCFCPLARQSLDCGEAQQGSPRLPKMPAPNTWNPGAAPGRTAQPRRTAVPGTDVWGHA